MSANQNESNAELLELIKSRHPDFCQCNELHDLNEEFSMGFYTQNEFEGMAVEIAIEKYGNDGNLNLQNQ